MALHPKLSEGLPAAMKAQTSLEQAAPSVAERAATSWRWSAVELLLNSARLVLAERFPSGAVHQGASLPLRQTVEALAELLDDYLITTDEKLDDFYRNLCVSVMEVQRNFVELPHLAPFIDVSLWRGRLEGLDAQVRLMGIASYHHALLQSELDEERAGIARRDAALREQKKRYDDAMDAQNALKQAFQQRSDDETGTANLLRGAAFVVILFVAAASLMLSQFETSSVIESVAVHLAVAVPGFALAGYLAREAAQHRRIARWAGIMAVQLATIKAYVEPLTDNDKSALMLHFGQRVLGDLPSDVGSAEDGNLVTHMSIIDRLIDRLPARS